MSSYKIKHADVLSDGLLITFADGREALLNEEDVWKCAESTGAFLRLEEFKREANEDDY